MSEHGYGRYSRGCRCQVCRQAKADYIRGRRAAGRTVAQSMTRSSTGRRGNGATAFASGATRYLASNITHGTRFGYDEAGCRCQPCTEARSGSDRRYKR